MIECQVTIYTRERTFSIILISIVDVCNGLLRMFFYLREKEICSPLTDFSCLSLSPLSSLASLVLAPGHLKEVSRYLPAVMMIFV